MTSWRVSSFVSLATLIACGPPPSTLDGGMQLPDSGASIDAGAGPDAFADRVVSFTPGAGAGFGQDKMPRIVLGPPEGGGTGVGSYDVVSLGMNGEIILAFDDLILSDGPGVDLLVFENAFTGFAETGYVAVSEDGADWHEWPCDPDDADGGYPGCAGVHPVFSSTESGTSPTDPTVAGGDGLDLAALGLTRARYVRVRDSGKNRYGNNTGGFDLDAVAIVHPIRPDGGPP